MRTPWGESQSVTNIAPGIISVSTAGHGGIKLDRTRNAMIPADARRKGGWYEEDSDACIPLLYFADEIRETGTVSVPVEDFRKNLETYNPTALKALDANRCKCGRKQRTRDCVVCLNNG